MRRAVMNEPITVKKANELLAEARRRAKAATAGPWEVIGTCIEGDYKEVVSTDVKCGRYCQGGRGLGIENPSDSAFIVLARDTFEPMLDYIEGRLDNIKIETDYGFDGINEMQPIYAPLAALKAHLEAK